MTSKVYNEFVKAPKIRSILDQETDCEDKIEMIKSLIDESKVNNVEEGGGGNGDLRANLPISSSAESAKPEILNNTQKREIVLKQMSGSERKNASALLDIIEKSNEISWDHNSYEVIINKEPIKFSDIRLLLKFVTTVSGLSHPVASVLFCNSLLSLKVPIAYFRSADSRQIRSNLQVIRNAEQQIKENATESLDKINEINNPSEDNENDRRGLKRTREGEDSETETLEEGEGGDIKRIKHSPEVVENFGAEPDELNKFRRSPRLRANIENLFNDLSQKKNDGRRRKKK